MPREKHPSAGRILFLDLGAGYMRVQLCEYIISTFMMWASLCSNQD